MAHNTYELQDVSTVSRSRLEIVLTDIMQFLSQPDL